MRILPFVLTLALYVFISPAVANEALYHNFGAGVDSCGTWLAEKGTMLGNLNNMWVLGFITAFNRYALVTDRNVALGTNADGMVAWIDNYCRAHPLDSIATTAENLTGELQARSRAR